MHSYGGMICILLNCLSHVREVPIVTAHHARPWIPRLDVGPDRSVLVPAVDEHKVGRSIIALRVLCTLLAVYSRHVINPML